MKRKILIIIVLLLCYSSMFCQQVTREEAIAVAKTEIFYTNGIEVNVTHVHQFDSNGHTLLYEVVSDRNVNVLVTGNKLCLPVVGRYDALTSTSVFDRPENLPCGLMIQDIQISPNPVSKTFLVNSNIIDLYHSRVIVFDMKGNKVIEKYSEDANGICMDVSNLPTGIYFVKIISIKDELLSIKKIVKK